uniref:RING-type E3 ubiquitin transferase n=1 Tax=Anthurium amnicola TaxID=1678845 RepID=A0A1D1YDW1_9ARAE
MTSAAGFPAAAAESVDRSLSEICGPDGDGGGGGGAGAELPWEPPRRFWGYAQRLRLLLTQLRRSSPPQDLCAPSVHTAFRGMAADLAGAAEAFAAYRSRSRIYVLIHCKPLCSSLHDRAASLGAWLTLLLDTPLPFSNPDIRKKAADLALDMQQANLRVTENEERVYCTLQKEGELRQSSKAVQSAIIMDLARALGMDAGDHGRLAEEIKLLKRDLSGTSSVAERRILVSLEKTFDSWSAEPYAPGCYSDADPEEDAHIPPFKNFICPLTKEVMREPVALESFQTYERTAITYWFDRCLEDGRDPTCPVTGQVLKTLELKPNIGLAGAIEEWVNRNIELQIKSALQYLAEEGSLPTTEGIERALDNVHRISEEYPASRYRVRNAGLVVLMVKLLKHRAESMGPLLRAKALMALHSMSRDDESKLMMLQEGTSRLAIRSLTSSLEEEKEFAAKLLLQFSYDEGYCATLVSEKGALVLLSSMSGSAEYPILSNIAEEILKNMEKVEDNLQHLAAAGRFQPLLARLSEGTEDVKIDVASLLGRMTLGNSDKENITRKAGRVLVNMLSSNLERQTASLEALNNLSTWDDNAAVLVDFGVLPALANILFKNQQDEPSSLKELAASTMANIVSKSGHWELASADKQGNRMQSEFIVHRLLELLSLSSSKCQLAILQTLYGITSSPQASDLAATNVRTGNGIVTVIPFLEHSEVEIRIYAFRLVSQLSERLGQPLVDELVATNKLLLFKEKLLHAESLNEKAEAAATLANLPISDEIVKSILGIDLLNWTVRSLNEQRSHSSGRNSRYTTSISEGLLGILLHFSRSSDPEIMNAVCENQLMTLFRGHLNGRSHRREKQRAALGLKFLSESASTLALTREVEPQPRGFCGPFLLMCGRSSMASPCPLHSVTCEENNSFCLLRGNTIKPLVDLMNDGNTQVQIAAVEALSTLVSDAQGLKNASLELEELGLFDAAIDLFKQVRSGDLQERVLCMVEKFSRVEALAQTYSTDQGLVMALVEAMKHGNPNTRRHAQDVLTHLRQLSGVGGRNSNHGRARRATNR